MDRLKKRQRTKLRDNILLTSFHFSDINDLLDENGDFKEISLEEQKNITSKKEDIFNYLYKNLQEILKDFLKYEDEKKYFDSIIDYDFSIFFDNLRDVNRYLNIFRFKKNALLNKVNKK